MTNLVAFKIIAAAIIFIVSLIAAYFPFYRKYSTSKPPELPGGESLASGVFFGAGLIHMLPDADNAFHRLGYSYPYAFLLAAVTFLLLLLLEHVSVKIKAENHNGFAYLALVLFSIHAFLAGATVGLSGNLAMAIIVFLAILAHKWAASFALAVKLSRSSIPMIWAWLLFLLFALMVPSGIVIGSEVITHIHSMPILEPLFLGLAAGTFLYLGTLHEFRHSVMIYRCGDYRLYAYMLTGFFLMAVVAIWT